MTFVCDICQRLPGSHSFTKIGVNENINYFYTCPAKAIKYDDNKGILKHYKGMLDNYPNEDWIWVFDGKGFEMKHAINIGLAIDLAKLIATYKNTLKKIYIINPSWHIKSIINITAPFLPDEIKKNIHIEDDPISVAMVPK